MEAKEILKEHGLRITEPRIELLKVFLKSDIALSNQDIESALPDADRITMYRTLKSFQEKGIIHKAIDGTEVNRYALCHSNCDNHDHHDNHIHFHCEQCDNTFCVEESEVPHIKPPQGFKVNETNVVMTGLCDRCQ